MLTYTNRLKKLILPEYGRNIQNMVDYCLTIEDRDERNICATTIIDAMQTLFPVTGDADEYRRKLWDHLAIMSNFSLDVDYPYDVVDRRVLGDLPDAVPAERPGSFPYRHYGRLIPRLIDTAVGMEPGEERDALVTLIANQMKKTLLASNPEGVEDQRILNDLRAMSHGEIATDSSRIRLLDFKQAPTPSGRKKKKK